MESVNLKGIVKIKDYIFRDKTLILYNELGENVVIEVDTYQQCCEDFAYDFSPWFEDDEIISTKGVEITKEVKEGYFFSDISRTLVLHIQGDIKDINLTVSNTHNGYYSHTVTLNSNNEFVWEAWL